MILPHTARPKAGRRAGGPIFVDVQVSVTPDGMDRISNTALRKGARAAHEETLVVARKLDQEIYAREQQRRVLWRR